MIFGRYDERGEQTPRAVPPPSADLPPGPGQGGERPPRPLYPEPGRS
jgi:hypothetical protein